MISWTSHREFTHESRQGKKRTHHQKKKKENDEWGMVRSGAMMAHHGCEAHVKNRYCVACFGDVHPRGLNPYFWKPKQITDSEWPDCREDGTAVVCIENVKDEIYRQTPGYTGSFYYYDCCYYDSDDDW